MGNPGGFIDAIGPAGGEDVNDGERTGGRVAFTVDTGEGFSITPRVVYQKITANGFNRQEIYNLYANPYTTTRPAVQFDEREQYLRLREAFERLAGTRITTNIATGDTETTTGFGLIESWEIVRRAPEGQKGAGKKGSGRMVSVAVTLSEWLYRAVLSKSVLTLSRDYFRLRKPLERRIYELARKHCGKQDHWRISVETLLKKSGSASPRRVFRKMIRDMIAVNHLPDYEMSEEEGDIIRFTSRARVLDSEGPQLPPLKSAALERARDMAPGWDVYALEADWRAYWAASGKPKLHSAEQAFLDAGGYGAAIRAQLSPTE